MINPYFQWNTYYKLANPKNKFKSDWGPLVNPNFHWKTYYVFARSNLYVIFYVLDWLGLTDSIVSDHRTWSVFFWVRQIRFMGVAQIIPGECRKKYKSPLASLCHYRVKCLERLHLAMFIEL